MFKKKKVDVQKSEKSAAKRKVNNRDGLQTHLIYLSIAVVIVTALTAAAFYFIQGGMVDQMRQQEARSIAQVLSARLTNTARVYRQVAVKAVQDDQLVALLREERLDEMKRYEVQMKRLLPSGVSVRFFPRGWDMTDNKSTPPVSFATLDMLRTVEQSGKPSDLEVHQVTTPRQHIAFAVPIGSKDDIVGSVLVALPFDQLQRIFDGVDTHLGLQLQQVAAGRSVSVVSMGNFPSSGVATVPVLDTIWQVAYVAGSVDRLDDLLLGLIIIVVAGLLLLLAAVFLNNRLKKSFHDDQVRLYKLAEGIGQGRSVAAPDALTVEMQAAFNLVAQL
ncbi:MAG: hypothetical protein MI754_17010, partial [Chromatiales bacterium]|nr:hypothetical protein [Chromatiales bacterium]